MRPGLVFGVDELHDLVDDDGFLLWTLNCRVFIVILPGPAVCLAPSLKVELRGLETLVTAAPDSDCLEREGEETESQAWNIIPLSCDRSQE